MRKVGYYTVFAFIISSALLSLATPTTQALTGWKAGRIIDDSVFTAYNSMSAAQIQSFLVGKVPSCDTNGLKLSENGGPDLNSDGKVQRWEWGKSRYNQTKFICLKDYNAGGKKASQIIYEKAQKYKISPKVLLVLLQKEQSLVNDTWPLNLQYRTATGYGCPDTAPCDSQYYGLANQLDWAAKMFRAILDNSPSWYTPYELGNNFIQYSPSSSCGGSVVNIENRSTQALYNYTPYQPNKAARDAGWGSASCGAYGNRNFFLYFSGWFGQPNAAATYGYSVLSQQIYSDAAYTTKIGDATASIEPGDPLYVKTTVKNTGNQVWYGEFLKLGTANPQDRVSPFMDSSWPSGGRPARMTESTVAAGGTATFKFKAMAPSSLATYPETFSVLIEGQRWLSGQINYVFTVSSPSPIYSVQSLGFTAYRDAARTSKLNAGTITTYQNSDIFITARLKNTGNRALPAYVSSTGLGTKIATTGPRNRLSVLADDSWITSNRPAASVEGTIAPGAIGTYNFSVTAPSSQVGASNEQLGLVIEGDRWVTDTLSTMSLNVLPRPLAQITSGQTLSKGETLLSPDERFRLIFQGDGNLVLYGTTGKALWNTRTNGTSANRLVMQGDGNLVLYSATGKALWNTQTARTSANRLALQSDGNLVLYTPTGRPLWNTHTAGAR